MFRMIIICLFVFSMIFTMEAECRIPTYNKSNFDPASMKIKEDDYLSRTVPDIRMVDHSGRPLTLRELSGKPLIISIIYYSCAHTCKPLNEGLAEVLSRLNLKIGEDFNVLTISFDKYDLPEKAMKFREALRTKMFLNGKLPENFDRWVFATATYEDIERLTNAVGYRFFWSKEDSIFVHPNVYIFLSPKGVITRYIFGLYPQESDVRLAILESSQGRVGKFQLLNAALLACFKYDQAKGVYKVDPTVIFSAAGLFTGFITASIVFIYSRKVNKQKRLQEGLNKT